MFCIKCGAKILGEAKFCTSCGNKLATAGGAPVPSSTVKSGSAHPAIVLLIIIVAIAVIGILSAVVLASLSSAREKAREAQQRELSGGTELTELGSRISADTNETESPEVQGEDIAVGTGREAKPGLTVSVLYVGKLTDGTIFDSSAAHDNEPLTFELGTEDLIPGFQIGVNGMKVGGERLLSIPPELGYGDQDVTDPETGEVVVPANSTLIFEVRLIDVQ